MISLRERIDLLTGDLTAKPMRISAYRDLPFTILRYDPAEEWALRREARLLATRLADLGKEVRTISLATLLWRAIEECEGIEAVAESERESGFQPTQRLVTSYLSQPVWCSLPDLLAEALEPLDPQRHVVFLTRAAALGPAIYHMSSLLDAMQGRSEIATILFYPGSLEGTTGLRFMGIKDHEAVGNYRVKIYG